MALLDLEVYGPTGQKVYQKFWNNYWFTAGVSQNMGTAWTVPMNAKKGTYRVKVGVFAPNWAQLFMWNDAAASFTVK